MRLLADECVYHITTETLRKHGYDVVTVHQAGLAGKPDDIILAHAVAEGRILITNDMHFSNPLLFPLSRHLGIIVLKIRPATLKQVHGVLLRLLATTDQTSMANTLVIVDRHKYRVHR